MTQPNEEVLREIVSNAIYRKSFNLLIQNEQLNVLDWSGKVMDVFTRQCEEMRRENEIIKKNLSDLADRHERNVSNGAIIAAELATAHKELERVRGQGVWMSIKSDVSAVVCEAVASTGRKIAEEYLNHLSNKYADKIHALINQEKK